MHACCYCYDFMRTGNASSSLKASSMADSSFRSGGMKKQRPSTTDNGFVSCSGVSPKEAVHMPETR